MMTAINWRKAQKAFGVPADGIPGPVTAGGLLAFAADRSVNMTIASMGKALSVHAKNYGVYESAERCADFVAQICNETGGFTRFEENLNYSADALARTWPGRYRGPDGRPNAKALHLARKPEAIANDTYALRMGNQSAAQDNDNHPDGWQYRGRGALQLTGKGNYRLFGQRLGLPLVEHPELAADPGVSVLIALEFYKVNNVWLPLDNGDPAGARKKTNGGTIGLTEVNRLRTKLLGVLTV